MSQVLVTGAGGFVGRPLCALLAANGHDVIAAVRPHSAKPEGVAHRDAPSLGPIADWSHAVAGMEVVVHLAARVHVMHDAATDPLAEFRAANTAGTLHLAEQAAAAGIAHFVFMSSIKVCGEETHGRAFGPEDAAPVDPYGISKLEAEHGLAEIAARTGMAVTILRPPLVYGPGVKGNLRALIGLIRRGVPLPLGRVANRRSLIGVTNLADGVRAALARPPAAGMARIYTLCDGEALSTAQLVRHLAQALGRPARLWPVPVGLMRLAGALTGKGAAVQRLTASLEVDSSAIRRELDWSPPVAIADGLAEMAGAWHP